MGACKYVGAFFAGYFLICWNYQVAISIELYMRMRRPYTVNFGNRSKIYHIVSQSIGIATFIILVLSSDNNGESIMLTCFIQDKTRYEFVLTFPLCVHTPIIGVLSIYGFCFLRGVKNINTLWVHLRFCFVFILCWMPILIIHSLNYNEFNIFTPDWFMTVKYT